jgi:hypothetical protein
VDAQRALLAWRQRERGVRDRAQRELDLLKTIMAADAEARAKCLAIMAVIEGLGEPGVRQHVSLETKG